MSIIAGGIVRGNVAIIEPQFTIFRPSIGVTQVYLAFPDRLNLRTLEDDPCLKGVLNKIVVVGFAIDSYYVGALRHIEILAPGYGASNVWVLGDRPSALPEIPTAQQV